jgi:hypothetical protein
MDPSGAYVIGMERDPKVIEAAFRRVRLQDLLSDVHAAWGVLALVVTSVGALIYYETTPRSVTAVVVGTAVGAHQPPSEDANVRMRVAVRLESGNVVNVPIPRGELYREGATVELEVIRRDWPPHFVTHAFVRYRDNPVVSGQP